MRPLDQESQLRGQTTDPVMMLSLEALRPGSASSTHFEAVALGLERAGRTVHRSVSQPSRLPRPLAMLRSQIAFLRAGWSYRKIYARWHVLDMSVILLSLLRRRVVLEVNGTTEDILISHPTLKGVAPLIRWIARIQFRMADGIVAVSPGIGAWVNECANRKRVIVAANGGDLRLADRRQPPASPPYAVFIGELAAWQGIETILVARTRPSWPAGLDLVIVGDGAVVDLVERYENRGLVRYEGRLDHSDAISILARARVSMSPQLMSVGRNRVMGRPLKISESLILGVPCVATGFPDTAELLAEFPGSQVIHDDDPDALAEAVSQAASVGELGRDATAAEAQMRCSWHDAVDAAQKLLYDSVGRA